MSIKNKIFESIVSQRGHIGYYRLPFNDTTHIKNFAKSVTKEEVVVIGIGGSSLGIYAIYRFLKLKLSLKKLTIIESTDPIALEEKLDNINAENTLFLVISKSGSTLETIALYKYLLHNYDVNNTNTLIITENDSDLNAYAIKHTIKTFDIPKSVGGRFSVFSNVGLVPLAIVGVDIDELLSGARETFNSFFYKKEKYDELMQKAYEYVKNSDRYNINCVFSYSELLSGFNKWYIQLWGESLGKTNPQGINVGLTPIGLTGPVDQHSFLQLIVNGKRDKSVTFIKIKDFQSDKKISNLSLQNLEDLDTINNLDFATLINMQADSVIESVKAYGDIPNDILQIEKVDEHSIGSLMYYYQLLTSITAQYFNINAYDQPGVEDGKRILKEKLLKK